MIELRTTNASMVRYFVEKYGYYAGRKNSPKESRAFDSLCTFIDELHDDQHNLTSDDIVYICKDIHDHSLPAGIALPLLCKEFNEEATITFFLED